MYLLLDANITAGYYLPRSLNSKRARGRVQALFDAVRKRRLSHFLYIPNFCIAEVFSVFAKHAFGRWNPHLKKRPTIDKRVYRSLRRQFAADIHNGRFLNQYELSRYHILGIDLIAPVDHYYKITRSKKRRHVPAGTFDHLIISMAIQLVHIHGQDKVAIVTSDDRLVRILDKCRNGLSANVVRRLHLNEALLTIGRQFRPEIFPQCLDLVNASTADLTKVLGKWPLLIQPVRGVYRWTRT